MGALLGTLASAQPPGTRPQGRGGPGPPGGPDTAGSPYANRGAPSPAPDGPGRGAPGPGPGGPGAGIPGPGGPGGAPAPARATVLAFAADGDRWAWLKRAGTSVELLAGGPGGARTSIAKGRGWTEVALEGESAWLLRKEGTRGALLKIQLAPGGREETVLDSLLSPGALRAHAGRVYWLEMPPSQPRFAFVPTAGSITRLKCREASGETRELGAWPGGGPDGPAAGDLIGFTSDAAFVRIRRLTSTELVRLPLAGGAPARVAAENGTPSAVIHAGSLYWTAPSPEAMPESLLECVRRLPLTGESGTAPVVADWLPPVGTLISVGDSVYDLAEGLYRIPARPGAAAFLRRAHSGRAASDGSHAVLLDEGEDPAAVPVRAE